MSTAYRYVGGGRFVMGLPARDLTAEDLADVLRREGIGEDVVQGCGLYVAEPVEVAPICGAGNHGDTEGRFGEGLCREGVETWGDRCEAHGGGSGEKER